MTRLLYALAIAGHGAAVQLVAGALVIVLGPWPWAGGLVLTAYAAFLVHSCRSRDLLAGCAWWARIPIVTLWQAPALIFGTWNLLAFLRLAPDQDIGCMVLHVWHAVFLPLADLVPRGGWRQVAWYLWMQSAFPWVLTAALVIAARRRAQDVTAAAPMPAQSA